MPRPNVVPSTNRGIKPLLQLAKPTQASGYWTQRE